MDESYNESYYLIDTLPMDEEWKILMKIVTKHGIKMDFKKRVTCVDARQ